MLLHPMQGHLTHEGRNIAQGGFLYPALGDHGFQPAESCPLFTRNTVFSQQTQDFLGRMAEIERVDLTGDMGDIVKTLGITLGEFQRAITTSVSAFPVRENLEAEAKILVPLETPVRNMLPRTPGAGLSSQWRQATSLGGGYGLPVVVASTTNTTSVIVPVQPGWQVGDWLYFAPSAETASGGGITVGVQKQITAVAIITAGTQTQATFVGAVSVTVGDVVVNLSTLPGTSGRHADGTFTTTNDSTWGTGTTLGMDIQSFFPETGAPEDRHTYYVNQLVGYKLLGAYGSVTGGSRGRARLKSRCIGETLN